MGVSPLKAAAAATNHHNNQPNPNMLKSFDDIYASQETLDYDKSTSSIWVDGGPKLTQDRLNSFNEGKLDNKGSREELVLLPNVRSKGHLLSYKVPKF